MPYGPASRTFEQSTPLSSDCFCTTAPSNPSTSVHSKRVDGKFLGPNGTVPASQAVCSSLLEECFDITQEIKAQDESKRVADSLKPIFDRVTEIRKELENLAQTHRWSLRETDLWNYTLSLQEIDKMRVDGKFMDLDRNIPHGQYVSILQLFTGEPGIFGTFLMVYWSRRCFCTCCGGATEFSINCFCRVNRCRRSLCRS